MVADLGIVQLVSQRRTARSGRVGVSRGCQQTFRFSGGFASPGRSIPGLPDRGIRRCACPAVQHKCQVPRPSLAEC